MRRPDITVISPVYNAAPFVGACVKSCQEQTLSNLELIFVDDGSTDDSLTTLKRLAENEPRLIVLHQENSGAAVARNSALDKAHGRFVYFIDADDYIPSPTALERLYQAATTQNVHIAGGSMCIDRDGVLDFDSLHGRSLDCFECEEVVEYRDYQYDYDFTRFIYSLDLINEQAIRFPALSQFEDPVFHVRIMLAAERFATIPDAVYAYRNGHQTRVWDERAVLDRLAGITTLLELSRERKLAKLHSHVLGQLDQEMTFVLLDHAGSTRVASALMKANSCIDCSLLQEIDGAFPDTYLVEALRLVFNDFVRMNRLRHSAPGRLYARLRDRVKKE